MRMCSTRMAFVRMIDPLTATELEIIVRADWRSMSFIVDGGWVWVTISKILSAEPAGSAVQTHVAQHALGDKTDRRPDTLSIGWRRHTLQRYPDSNDGWHDDRRQRLSSSFVAVTTGRPWR